MSEDRGDGKRTCKFCGYPSNGRPFCTSECEIDYKEREVIKKLGERL